MKWSSVICVLGGAALVAVALAFGPYLPLSELSIASGGMLDEAPRSTAATVRTHFESIGPEGRGLYRSHFFFDLAFLTANALVLFGLLRRDCHGHGHWVGRSCPYRESSRLLISLRTSRSRGS